jgi:hypothetical protein
MERECPSRDLAGVALLLPGCREEPRSLLQTLTAVALFASRQSRCQCKQSHRREVADAC